MASLQATCTVCEKTVTAFTLIGDSELEIVLERGEQIMVQHFLEMDPEGSSITSGVSPAKRKKI